MPGEFVVAFMTRPSFGWFSNPRKLKYRTSIRRAVLMPSFGTKSKARLATCHPDLQVIFNEVIKRADCSVICGHRGKEEQQAAFDAGNSKLQYPKSRHNSYPSEAVDVVPYPLDWNDHLRFAALANVVKNVAREMNIPITWGGDWKSFKDLPHYELVQK
jgi:peptidoglycan L-alanyl-D-glutamate endopeptidase CwlK